MLAAPAENNAFQSILGKLKRDAADIERGEQPKEIIPAKYKDVEKKTMTTEAIIASPRWKEFGLDSDMATKLTEQHLLTSIAREQETIEVYDIVEKQDIPKTGDEAFKVFTDWLQKENKAYSRRLASGEKTESTIKTFGGRRAASIVKYLSWMDENAKAGNMEEQVIEQAVPQILLTAGLLWGIEYQFKHDDEQVSNNHAGAAGIVGLLVETLVEEEDPIGFWREIQSFIPKDSEFERHFEGIRRGVNSEVIAFKALSNSNYLKEQEITVRIGNKVEDANQGTDIVLSKDGKTLICVDVKSSNFLQVVGLIPKEEDIKTIRLDTMEEVDLEILLTPFILVKYLREKGGKGMSIRVPYSLTGSKTDPTELVNLAANIENMVKYLIEEKNE